MTRGGPGDFIPRPISSRSISELSSILESESWIVAILETLYQDYLEDWAQQVSPLSERCKQLQSTIHTYDHDSGTVLVDRESLLAAYAVAEQAVVVIEQLDSTFFEDLLLTLPPEPQQAARRHGLRRMLDLLLRGSDPIFNPRGVAYPTPNVMVQMDRLELAEAERARIDSFLQEETSGLLEQAVLARNVRFDSERRIHEMNQRMMSRLADGSASSSDYGVAYRRVSDELLATHGSTSVDWNRAYRAFAEGLSQRLDPGNREVFHRHWLEAAHPAVFQQAVDARPSLVDALEFADLSAEQVETITKVMVEYERTFTELSEELVKIDSELGRFGAHTAEEDYDQWRVLQQAFESAEFRRDQASVSVLRQLYLYLTPDQRSRLPALRGFSLD